MATEIKTGRRGDLRRDGDDGVNDRDDECPHLAQGPGGKKGCPLARVDDDEIAIAAPIEFEMNRAILKDASRPVLEAVRRVLHERPDIRLVEIQGHTDARGSAAHGLRLTGLQAKSVRQYLIDHGVDSSRLEAKGYGNGLPIADDKACLDPEKDLTPKCREALAENRRVVFLIRSLGPPPPRPIADGEAGSAALLPKAQKPTPEDSSVLPFCKAGAASNGCVLPRKEGVLKKDTVLEKPNTLLPNEPVLPSGGTLLPRGGSNLPQR